MIIGLTGGIAAGKSIVREQLVSEIGMQTFDADACVHRLLVTDTGLAHSISREFGPRYLTPEGAPYRAALRELIFHDAEARRKLECLIHPRVHSEWQPLRDDCLETGGTLLADIPLLYETKAETFFDCIVVVACSPATQLGRLDSRGLSSETAKAMLASQLPMGQKVLRASFVIWNDGSLASLGRQVQLLSNQLFAE